MTQLQNVSTQSSMFYEDDGEGLCVYIQTAQNLFTVSIAEDYMRIDTFTPDGFCLIGTSFVGTWDEIASDIQAKGETK